MAERGARLLVADDNKVNRLLLSRSLELQGHRVALAENGRVALEMLGAEAFDLLLLDIEMPEMDGFQVLERLKGDLKLRDLPVIVTSAVEGLDSVVRCIELGAEDYLSKPVNAVLLKARIGASLEKKRLRDQQKELVRRFATREVADDLDASGFALGGRTVQATVMFSDIRGFTSMLGAAAARGNHRAAQHLLHADVRRHQRPGRRGEPDDRRRPDGDLRRAAAAGRPLRAARCARRRRWSRWWACSTSSPTASASPRSASAWALPRGRWWPATPAPSDRATYTCVGDTVNLAARIEAHTKEAGCAILIDGETAAALDSQGGLTALGAVQFKGKAGAVEVFRVAPA